MRAADGRGFRNRLCFLLEIYFEYPPGWQLASKSEVSPALPPYPFDAQADVQFLLICSWHL